MTTRFEHAFKAAGRLLVLLSTIALLPAQLARAEEPDPKTSAARSAVDGLVDQVLAELSRKDVEDDVKIKSLEQIVFGEFDFRTISRLVLARNFKKFSKQQQDEFEGQFKVYLSRSYGNRLLRYANEKVEFVGARVEPRGDVTVMTMIVGGTADGFAMNYRMRNKGDVWKVIDVVIEGISLVSNFRTQFKDIISRDGPDGLLAKLRDKTFVLEDPEPEAAS